MQLTDATVQIMPLNSEERKRQLQLHNFLLMSALIKESGNMESMCAASVREAVSAKGSNWLSSNMRIGNFRPHCNKTMVISVESLPRYMILRAVPSLTLLMDPFGNFQICSDSVSDR
jgi:hypothetical protein